MKHKETASINPDNIGKVQKFIKANTNVIGNYSLEKTIGEGTFGKVKLGYHIPTGEKVANFLTLGRY
jgi:hypothetical protein